METEKDFTEQKKEETTGNQEPKNRQEVKPAKETEGSINNKRIALFLIITFVITYAVEIFFIMPMAGSADLNQAMMAQSLMALVMFIPSIGAVLTRILTKERFLGSNIYLSLNLKRNLKYYGLAWFGFAALIIFGAVLYFLIFPKQFDANLGYAAAVLNAQAPVTPEEVKQTMISQIIMGILLSPLLNIMNCFGEEWGWRGYLLPKMLKRFPVVPTLLITGLIWGLWHAPLTMMGHNYGVGYPGFPYTGIMAMCAFCIVIGIILSYVTIKTKSCIPAILGHGMLNGFSAIGMYLTSLENPFNIFLGPTPVGLIGGMGFIIVAAILLFLLYKEEKNQRILM